MQRYLNELFPWKLVLKDFFPGFLQSLVFYKASVSLFFIQTTDLYHGKTAMAQ